MPYCRMLSGYIKSRKSDRRLHKFNFTVFLCSRLCAINQEAPHPLAQTGAVCAVPSQTHRSYTMDLIAGPTLLVTGVGMILTLVALWQGEP